MRINKNRLILLATNLLILVILLFICNSTVNSQFSLALLFTVLLWKRTEPHVSRWFAVSVLWAGLVFAVIFPQFVQL